MDYIHRFTYFKYRVKLSFVSYIVNVMQQRDTTIVGCGFPCPPVFCGTSKDINTINPKEKSQQSVLIINRQSINLHVILATTQMGGRGNPHPTTKVPGVWQ